MAMNHHTPASPGEDPAGIDTSRPEFYVLDLQEVDGTQEALVGGKGSNLGELSRIEGITVPAGFCVTTNAFRRVMSAAPAVADLLDQLSQLGSGEQEPIRSLSSEIRRIIEATTMPDDVAAAVTLALARHGEQSAYAVRSSATAEDSPTASFAGQHETYLSIVGPAAILQHLMRVFASLFTERAVTYRLRNDFDHRRVQMAVVVQRMASPQVSGVLFTADPVTSNRKLLSIEASFGLGEGLISGRVDADVYKVRDDEVLEKTIATKRVEITVSPSGGTRERMVDTERQGQPALTDAQLVRLARLGRRVEAHLGCPQDIEWCMSDDCFEIVQSRPITTLFPIPVAGDAENHVYVSVGHQQMMTDAMKPLGLSLFQLTALVPMHEAGGRLFVDVTRRLASAASRDGVLDALGKSDPLIRDGLERVLERGDFIRLLQDESSAGPPAAGPPAPVQTDPAVVAELIERSQASLASLSRHIQGKSGSALFDFVLADIQELKRLLLDPQSMQVIMAAMQATWWLNERLNQWLGESNAADTLTQSVSENVTSEMGLALMGIADVIRPYPEVVAFLEDVEDEGFMDELTKLDGGREARDAITAFLDRYGMRCVGEIDITRPRWSEQPSALLPVILGNIRNLEPGAGPRRFEHGLRKAREKEKELLERLRSLPGGEQKAEETKRMIDRVRTFIGYREYPKYAIASRYFIYKQALLGEAERLVRSGVLQAEQDIFYLALQELPDIARRHEVRRDVISRRRLAFRSHQALTPPRVLTSEGQCISGEYRREDVPAGALTGLAVSGGTVEGRARVILDIRQADVEPGDILVTTYTDPGWSPLFVAIEGLVTEVGGLMTHGAVIAREYGLPAVVGVEHATRLIPDGQRIRVHGTEGYVEILL